MFNITKKSLLELPEREWNKTTIYDSIILINSKKRHSSGYAIMYIIGCINQKPIEIIKGSTDSINWNFSGLENGLEFGTDMLYPSGLIHFFGINCRFEVDTALSSTSIDLIEKEGE